MKEIKINSKKMIIKKAEDKDKIIKKIIIKQCEEIIEEDKVEVVENIIISHRNNKVIMIKKKKDKIIEIKVTNNMISNKVIQEAEEIIANKTKMKNNRILKKRQQEVKI